MKKASHLEIGQKGEALAAELLVGKGFVIIEKNYRFKKAEIDLIAQKDSLLVFVEVKTRTNVTFGMPEEFVSKHKIQLITMAAEEYTYQHKWHQSIRFDIVAVVVKPNGETEVEHFEDAFY
ncbi:MAG: YraN family protein [Spirosomataceae bacterium]